MATGRQSAALVVWVISALAAGGVLAETASRTIFQRGAWDVQIVDFEDGTQSCVANVYLDGDSFSLWADSNAMVRLQFFSEAWEFGEGTTANLEVEIDRRSPWTMTNAELYLQSVLFDIPDSDQGVAFLTEVMQGRTLYLRNESGEHVQAYPLAGSSASIQTLIDCVGQIGRPSNPFN
jgi:hypothetical protein